jgi:hypothetical protein
LETATLPIELLAYFLILLVLVIMIVIGSARS